MTDPWWYGLCKLALTLLGLIGVVVLWWKR